MTVPDLGMLRFWGQDLGIGKRLGYLVLIASLKVFICMGCSEMEVGMERRVGEHLLFPELKLGFCVNQSLN